MSVRITRMLIVHLLYASGGGFATPLEAAGADKSEDSLSRWGLYCYTLGDKGTGGSRGGGPAASRGDALNMGLGNGPREIRLMRAVTSAPSWRAVAVCLLLAGACPVASAAPRKGPEPISVDVYLRPDPDVSLGYPIEPGPS